MFYLEGARCVDVDDLLPMFKTMHLSSFILMTAFLLGVGMSVACSQNHDPVQLQDGLVSGKKAPDSSVRAYLGIPFAAPPVGDLRWREPQPVTAWEGVRAADQMPAACIQDLQGSRLPWTEEFMHQGQISEDCLYLNVWTAAQSADEKRPVMVYIYGGAFSEGSNAVAVYDGEALAKKGVVLAVINYRVGVLGFMAHPELTAESEHNASGNYGLLDQVAALQWVQNNIGAFGGDPDQVTIFGQSAGAMSVAMLMHSPLAEGLFARAIIQSGPGLFSHSASIQGTPLARGEAMGVQFAEAKGAESLAALRAMTPEALMASDGAPRGYAGPVVDGWFLPDGHVNENEVPVMNGFTADDISIGSAYGPAPEATVAAYEEEARRQYGDRAEIFLSLYPAASDADVPAMRKASAQDRARVSLSLWASEQATRSSTVYTYYFDRAIPWPEHPEFGAFHTGEVPYVFNTLTRLERPWEEVDVTVAERTSSYWTNFARAGDPNGPDLPEWERYNASSPRTMRVGAEMGAMSLADPARVSFWTEALTATAPSR